MKSFFLIVCFKPRALHAVTNATMEARSCFCFSAIGRKTSHPLCGWSLALNLFLVFAAGAVWADENAVTVYNKNLGLVKQVRTLDVRQSALPLRFTDVAAKLIPTSVHLRSLTGNRAFQVLEQNFEYDLVSSERILEKYIDHPIEIIRADGELVTGVLMSKHGGSMVLKTEEGIKILPWNDKMSVNVKELPEGLITRPTLIWELSGVKDGKEKLEVSYLTSGMDWHAEYVGILDEASENIDLNAWVSINNQCGADFKDAKLKLVAGDIHRAPETPVRRRRGKRVDEMTLQAAATPTFEERGFFEYHIYELERLTTLRDNQIKQIALFPQARVTSEKKFFFNARRDPRKVDVRLLFKNDKQAGLGKPLPAGIFRIYQKDKESLEFVGEDRIDHTPRNEEVKITLGKAFDLSGERKIIDRKKVSKGSERQTIEIELRNSKEKDDVIIVVEEELPYRHWKIEDAGFSFTKKDAHLIAFQVPVRAKEKTILRYTVLVSW